MHVGHKHFLPLPNVSGEMRAKRKKPVNPEEIAPVKGRFSEDEQQERRRRPPQNPPKSVRPRDEADAVEADRAFGKPLSPPSSGIAASAAPMPSAQMPPPRVPSAQAVARLDALLSGIIGERRAIEAPAITHREAPAEPSLCDLLALMCAAPQKP
ncbi:MAG: hypothetical protein ACYC5H_14485 [Methylovirgula sp.]